MRYGRFLKAEALATGAAMSLVGCSSTGMQGNRLLGQSKDIGNGTVTSYGELAANQAPTAMGVVYSPGALEG